MYPGVRPDFDAAAVDLWKIVQKQALTAREGDVGNRRDGSKLLLHAQALIQSASTTGALEPVLSIDGRSDPASLNSEIRPLPFDAGAKAVSDHVQAVLPLNFLRKIHHDSRHARTARRETLLNRSYPQRAQETGKFRHSAGIKGGIRGDNVWSVAARRVGWTKNRIRWLGVFFFKNSQ